MRALYGHKSAGNSWHTTLTQSIEKDLGYVSNQADPDVYRKAKTKENGDKYYAYIFFTLMT